MASWIFLSIESLDPMRISTIRQSSFYHCAKVSKAIFLKYYLTHIVINNFFLSKLSKKPKVRESLKIKPEIRSQVRKFS